MHHIYNEQTTPQHTFWLNLTPQLPWLRHYRHHYLNLHLTQSKYNLFTDYANNVQAILKDKYEDYVSIFHNPQSGPILNAGSLPVLTSSYDAYLDWTQWVEPNPLVTESTEQFNTVFANGILPFIPNLKSYLKQVQSSLASKGVFYGCLLGNQTAQEVRESFIYSEVNLYNQAKPRWLPNIHTESVQTMLKWAGFKNSIIDQETTILHLPSPYLAIDYIRQTGLSQLEPRNQPVHLPKALYKAYADYYHQHFSHNGTYPLSLNMIYFICHQ